MNYGELFSYSKNFEEYTRFFSFYNIYYFMVFAYYLNHFFFLFLVLC